MVEVRTDAEVPCLQVHLDTDPLQADRQLQQALRLNASRESLSQKTPTKRRKHTRSLSSYVSNSDVSETSGRFDDADELEALGEDNDPNDRQGMIAAMAMMGHEHDSPAHSAKRRRSNDWPAQSPGRAQSEQEDERSRSNNNEGSFSRRWRLGGGHLRRSPRGAMASAAAAASSSGKHGTVLPRGRRSRFVEGNMNDSVSEKPPSIFLRDDWHVQQEAEEKGASHGNSNKTSSGIFRFGKAIASAFNPFGGWGSVSDVWKGGGSGTGSVEEHLQQQQNDDIARVQKAYEELKKSGYKGTVKGAYTQGGASAQDPSGLPEETWKAIQEKMECRQPSQDTTMSGGAASIRTSLQDLRKAKSSLGISGKLHPERRSEDSDCLEVRKQRSRKDLLRQAKLLKKVSNLEDKLERARRELRELRGDQAGGGGQEEPVPAVPTVYQEKPYQAYTTNTNDHNYPRKFVPGALPTLPSERWLEGQAAAEDHGTRPLQSLSPNVIRAGNASTSKSPATKQPSLTAESHSPSLKRKSPDPEALEALDVTGTNQEDHGHDYDDHHDNTIEEEPVSLSAQPTPTDSKILSRKAKLQKIGKSDSPGSVERKQSHERLANSSSKNNNSNNTTPVRTVSGQHRQRYLKPTSLQSSPSGRRSNSTSPRNASNKPSLRTRQGRSDLRSDDGENYEYRHDDHDRMDVDGETTDTDTDTKDLLLLSSSATDISSLQQQYQQQLEQRPFYLQEHRHLDPNHQTNGQGQGQASPSLSPSPSSSSRRSNRSRYEYIPPVPPLPKDLAATAAKVDRRLAKELAKRGGRLRQQQLQQQQQQQQQQQE